MEYTRRKPSPDLTYCSLMALERIGGVFSSRFHALDDLNAHIFLLTSSVEYVEESNFLVDHALLAIEICEDKDVNIWMMLKMAAFTLDGWIVLVDEMTLNELDT